jgi:hypothetical protein
MIDALDECPRHDGERVELLAALAEIRHWNLPGLHIMATSRKEPDIEEALTPLLTCSSVCIQTNQVDGDIRKHVKSQLDIHRQLKKWPPEIKKEIEDALVHGAAGMYVISYFHQFTFSHYSPCDIKVSMGRLSIRFLSKLLEA